MGAFFSLDSHSMVYFIICEIHEFPVQFPIAWENGMKSIELGEPTKLVPIFSLTYGYFSSIRIPFYGIICCHKRNAWFFSSKSTLWPLWLFSRSIIFYSYSKIYWFLERKNRKTWQGKLLFLKKRKTNPRHVGIQSKIYQRKKSEWMRVSNINVYLAKACHPTQIFPYS